MVLVGCWRDSSLSFWLDRNAALLQREPGPMMRSTDVLANSADLLVGSNDDRFSMLQPTIIAP